MAFVNDSPGPIRIIVTTPGKVEVVLRGAQGIAASASGSGRIDLTHAVSAAEVAASRLWGVIVTSDVPTRAEVSVTHPGRIYGAAEVATFPEVRGTTAKRAARVAALQAARPPFPERPPTVQMMNDMAIAVASTRGRANAGAIGAPLMRTGAQVRGHVLPRGVIFEHPSIPAGTLLPPTTAGSASTTGGAAPIVPRITGITVASVDRHAGISTAPCVNALCTIHSGDVLTITGSDFSKIAQQAHLGFITANTDILAPASLWTDAVVTVQVPPDLHGMADQPGIIWLGAPNSPDQSSVYVFDYRKTLTTMKLSFESKCYPPASQLFGGSATGILPNETAQGYLGGDPTVFTHSVAGLVGAGGSGDDILLHGVTLKNGWLVDRVVFDASFDGHTGADAFLVEQHPSTPNAQLTIHWWFNGFSSVTYVVSIFATGEANTSPYLDGYPSGPLPCMP